MFELNLLILTSTNGDPFLGDVSYASLTFVFFSKQRQKLCLISLIKKKF
jgi:hypothetical protein